jgi:hypothetical protein
MDGPRAARLVEGVLRCYPARWRRRHGAEAAELAALLISDGTPAASVAVSYLAGAAREWLTPRRGRSLTAVACALLILACSVGVSAGLLASAGPARAASTSQAHGHAHCRLSSHVSVPPKGHSHIATRGAGHGRPC